ncbi:hypothetical protein Lal_00014141 [Lupinus albus]|nr:hypothetical protein Lal_00014141 [Lupinus albus]
MASSSRTKKQRSSVKGTSSLESNPLNLTRLLANDEQRKVFEEHFHGRTIFTPKFANVGNFEFEDFIFPYLLRILLQYDFQKNHLTSYVNGKDISLDAKTFSSLCWNIPTQGSTTGFGLDNFDRKGFYYSLCRISKEEIEKRKKQGFGEIVKNRDILSCGYLKLEDRLLHYFMIYVILPKFSNHSQISDIEPN